MKKIIALVATVVFITTIGFVAVGKKLPSVGYVLVGPHTDGGWSMRHHQGFQSLTKHGYKVSMVEMVPEAESTKQKYPLKNQNQRFHYLQINYYEGYTSKTNTTGT